MVAPKGRATGAIKNPSKGGAAKRMIAATGGGRKALNQFRAMDKPMRQNVVTAASQGANISKMLRGGSSMATSKRVK